MEKLLKTKNGIMALYLNANGFLLGLLVFQISCGHRDFSFICRYFKIASVGSGVNYGRVLELYR